jgi:hypothetical protein
LKFVGKERGTQIIGWDGALLESYNSQNVGLDPWWSVKEEDQRFIKIDFSARG